MTKRPASRETAERHVKDIRRKTRKRYQSEEKIRIILSGLRGNVTTDQKQNNRLLRHQFASNPRCILNDTRSDAVALDPIKQRHIARARLDGASIPIH